MLDVMMLGWNPLLAQPSFPGAACRWEYVLIKDNVQRENVKRKVSLKKCVYQLCILV